MGFSMNELQEENDSSSDEEEDLKVIIVTVCCSSKMASNWEEIKISLKNQFDKIIE